MKYKVGDKVRIVKEKVGDGWNSLGLMNIWLGEVMTIDEVYEGYGVYNSYYRMKEDIGYWFWYESMIEGRAEMTKSDLIAGKHIVELRNGNKFLVFDSNGGKFFYRVDGRFSTLANHNEDLTSKFRKEYDVMKVYEAEKVVNNFLISTFEKEYLNLIWERPKQKEMTMEELEKELGYKVKIIKEH